MNNEYPQDLTRYDIYNGQPSNTRTAPRQTSPKRKNDKRNIVLIIAGCVAIMVAGIIFVVMYASSSSTSTSTTPTLVAQPDTAAQVAAKLGCTNFKDLGGSDPNSPIQGVVDSGNCYINGKKYGINTFISKEIRDNWLPIAALVGVNPKWETDTSVVYPSTKPDSK